MCLKKSMKYSLMTVTFWNHFKSFPCFLAFFLFSLASPQETCKFPENKTIDSCLPLCSQCLVQTANEYLFDKMV